MNIKISKEAQKVLVLLFTIDALFIILDVALRLGFHGNRHLSIEMDRGHPEVFQYIKEIWICMLLLIASTKQTRLLYFSWAVLFFYLLIDDSMQVHENGGRILSGYFEFKPMLHLRATDFGELIVSCFFGSGILALIAFSYFKSEPTEKRISVHIFALTMFLAVFGVLVDMLHIAIPWGTNIFGVIEDGGEMLIMSALVVYVFDLQKSSTQVSDFLNSDTEGRTQTFDQQENLK